MYCIQSIFTGTISTSLINTDRLITVSIERKIIGRWKLKRLFYVKYSVYLLDYIAYPCLFDKQSKILYKYRFFSENNTSIHRKNSSKKQQFLLYHLIKMLPIGKYFHSLDEVLKFDMVLLDHWPPLTLSVHLTYSKLSLKPILLVKILRRLISLHNFNFNGV